MLIFKTYINPIDGVTPLYAGTEISSANISNGGNGYALNDIFTINGGNELSIGWVLSVNSGVVTSFSILFKGFGYSIVNGLTTNATTGMGAGLIVNVTGLCTRNTTFCHSVLGNDSNPGTRTLPVQTLTKCNTLNYGYSLISGTFIENANGISSIAFIADSDSVYINGNFGSGGYNQINHWKLHVKVLQGIYNPACILNGNIDLFSNIGDHNPVAALLPMYGNFIKISKGKLYGSTFYQNTLDQLYNYVMINSVLNSCIIISLIDLYRYISQTNVYFIFKYCLFRKNTLWKWNGVTIPITYIDPSNYILDVWNSLYSYANSMSAGTDKSYLLLMLGSSFATCPIFYTDISIGQTNKVIDDNPTTGVPIFNKYSNDGNIVLDYSLALSSNNIALSMGDPELIYQYVGCYKTNIGGQNTSNPMVYSSIICVNDDGSDDTITIPTLLMTDVLGNFLMNQDSIQFWNRVRTNVLSYDRGKSSFGTGSQLSSAMGSGYYFGKKRKYDATHCVVETIEVLPYDNPTTPSTSPKFSMAFNGQTLVYYWTGGIKIGLPVLFNDLAGIGISVDATFLSIYGTWAVSTSDLESYDLSQFTSLIGAKQYPLTYFVGELNAHYKS